MTQIKFGRRYVLNITLQNGSILTIEPPFRIDFDITRKVLSSSNVGSIRIYNLGALNRALIRYDYSNYGSENGPFRLVTLQAGYGPNLPTIFIGNITHAWSVREGTNFITTIEAFDGGVAIVNGKCPTTPFPKNTTQFTVLSTLMIQGLPGVQFGAIGPSFQYVNKVDGAEIITTRGNPYSGETVKVLNELTGNSFFIDNNKSYCLATNECLPSPVQLIDAQSGLLNTPVREISTVYFDMQFEPGLFLGQYVQLNSSTFVAANSIYNQSKDNVNGYYKIWSLKHRGTISDATCGEAITTVEFFLGPQALKII